MGNPSSGTKDIADRESGSPTRIGLDRTGKMEQIRRLRQQQLRLLAAATIPWDQIAALGRRAYHLELSRHASSDHHRRSRS